jgi:hypothetical protein
MGILDYVPSHGHGRKAFPRRLKPDSPPST